MALLGVVEGRELGSEVAQGAALVATVIGQDLDEDAEGVFRIARRVAKDRVISTVDSQARHGHKTAARGFDGYKDHVGIDPDSEIITATTVTPGNAGDAGAATDLMTDLAEDPLTGAHPVASAEPVAPAGLGQSGTEQADDEPGDNERGKVFGDCAYGSGEFQSLLEEQGIDSGCKTQPPAPRPGGLFTEDRFDIDLDRDTVTCPGGVSAPIRRGGDGAGTASFGAACAGCPLREGCTSAAVGRTVTVSAFEAELARARARQADPAWQADYTATRPKVERKIGHLMRRKHGGRRARMRGLSKVTADFAPARRRGQPGPPRRARTRPRLSPPGPSPSRRAPHSTTEPPPEGHAPSHHPLRPDPCSARSQPTSYPAHQTRPPAARSTPPS